MNKQHEKNLEERQCVVENIVQKSLSLKKRFIRDYNELKDSMFETYRRLNIFDFMQLGFVAFDGYKSGIIHSIPSMVWATLVMVYFNRTLD